MSAASVPAPEAAAPPKVVAVLATYRDRSAMLEAVLDRLADEGVARAVVIDNGASWPVADRLAARFGGFADVVAMGGNRGCALAYARGLERALALGADMIWLLDDDNRPAPGALAALLSTWRAEVAEVGADRLIVTALREEHHADVLAGVPERRLKVRWDSFGGFHLADLPYKLWRRTRWGRPSGVAPATARVDVTPYGGSLFARALAERFGPPMAELYQYGDDIEFTWRVTRAGGRLVVVTAARIEDLEASWNPTVQLADRFRGLVAGSSDLRAFYSVRNAAFVESRLRRRNRLMFALNRLAYLALVRFHARRGGRPERYRLVLDAVRDGLAGRLAADPRFPLT